MYQLYYYPLNASMAPHFVLEELGVDFELILVDRKSNAQKSDEYLALNPAGRIPTLVDDGFAVSESAAICLYLCDQNLDSQLIPAIGNPERAVLYQWLMYLTNTMQSGLMLYFYPEKYTTECGSSSYIRIAQEHRVTEMFELLDRELENKTFLIGNHITICDYFLLMLSIWADEFDKPPLSFPNLGRYLRELTKREAVQKVCKKENISLLDYE